MKKTKLETDLFYYGNYLELIGKFSLSKQLTLKDLGDTDEDKAVIQKCYRDMKREKFNGTVIDYLCFISFEHILTLWDKELSGSGEDDFNLMSGNLLAKSRVKATGKYDKHNFLPLAMVIFLLICNKYKGHGRNTLRLFNKNPKYIIEHKELKRFNRLAELNIVTITLNIFNLMMILNCYEFLRENLQVINEETENSLWEYMLPKAIETIAGRKFIDLKRPKKEIAFNTVIYFR